MLSQCTNNLNCDTSLFNPNNNDSIKNKDVAIWIRFLRQMRLPQMFANLTDRRDASKTTYSNVSLALWAFSACAFRQGSKNALNTTLNCLKDNARASVANFLEIKGLDLPHSKTVDSFLRNIPHEELNEILLQVFMRSIKSKLFYNHSETLLPDNYYLLGCDGFHTHTYTEPHAVDEKGQNTCPYCLPRRLHANTPDEKTYWVHVFVTFVIIFPTGLKMPLYIYPLKAQQVDVTKDNEAFKQECELKAVHAVLPIIRAYFPRTSFIFAGDGLYANEPFILLCDNLNFDYLIVRKEKSLKLLGKHCDELERTELYQKAYAFKEIEQQGKIKITRQARWFNHEALGKEAYTNVLRFEEFHEMPNGTTQTMYKGEWLSGRQIGKINCFARAKRGRMRWEHEDLHNTAKNRGFDAMHDMARTDFNLWLVWKMMLFIAFSIFELFRCTTLAQEACKKRSWMKFSKDLLQQLVEVAWEVIAISPILQKENIQFRYSFCHPP